MLKFDDPKYIDQLHILSGKISAEVDKALASEHYQEFSRLRGVEQGLVLAIEMARGESVRVPQNHDVPFLGAYITTLYEDG